MVTSQKLLVGSCLIASCAFAQAASSQFLPTTPGVSAYGFGGNGWTAIGDALIPAVGQPLNFTFIDPQIYYHSSDGEVSGSLALGQRWLTANAGILGAYVFGDYNHSNAGNDFWFVSPGFERLGKTWDFSVNAYIPVTDQRRGETFVFDGAPDDPTKITFAGHNQYHALDETFQSVGWGGDIQVGVRTPFRNSRVYLGAYYFNPQDHDSITGGAVRAEVPVNDYVSVVMSEAYDSEYNNTLKAGLSLSLGGRTTGYHFNGDLTQRLVDPIQRNLIAVAGGAHNAQPIVNGTEETDALALQKTNISFFLPETVPGPAAPSPLLGAVVGNGTYENPYRGISQDNVDNANVQNNRNFYIESGIYHAAYNPLVNPDFIVLNNDLLYGRQNNFTAPAQGNARPLIQFTDAGFLITSGVDRFSGLQLAGNDLTNTAGIFVDNEIASDTQVAVDNALISHFGDGIDIYNTADSNISFNLANSTLTQNSAGGMTALATACANLGSFGSCGGAFATAHLGAGELMLNIENVNIVENANGDARSLWGGFFVFNYNGLSTAHINYSDLSNNGVSGMFVEDESSENMSIAIDHSQFNQEANDGIDIFSTAANVKFQLFIDQSHFDNNNGGLFFQFSNADTVLIHMNHSSINNNNMEGLGSQITAQNVEINFQNSMILENSNNGISLVMGVPVNSQDNISLQNVTVSNNGINGLNIINASDLGTAWHVTVDHSTFENNAGVGINIQDSTTASALNPATADLSISNSTLIGNAGGGLSFSSTNSVVSGAIRHSTISDSTTATGVDLTFDGNPQVSFTIEDSTIADNQTGVSLISDNSPGPATVTINHSGMSGNTLGLSAQGNANPIIHVTNPSFFDGVIQFSGNGAITFPDVTPSSGDHVLCTPAGCSIVP